MADREVLKAASDYANEVRKKMNTRAIFLYGSQAKGTATKYSDIDIAVIVDSVPGDYLSAVSDLWKLTRGINDAIEPVLLTPSDRDSGFMQTVEKTGIAV